MWFFGVRLSPAGWSILVSISRLFTTCKRRELFNSTHTKLQGGRRERRWDMVWGAVGDWRWVSDGVVCGEWWGE